MAEYLVEDAGRYADLLNDPSGSLAEADFQVSRYGKDLLIPGSALNLLCEAVKLGDNGHVEDGSMWFDGVGYLIRSLAPPLSD